MNILKNLPALLFAMQFAVYFSNNNGLQAQTTADYKTIKLANKAYTDGNFKLSAELYERVASKGFSAAELNYNLGNAYYRLGDYKRAILHYERAKLISPDDENIKINLEFAQRYIQDKIEVVPAFFLVRWTNGFVNLFSASAWSVISIFTFIMLLALIVLFLFSKSVSYRKFAVYIGFVSAIISLISFYCAYEQYQKLTSHKTAIVFSPAVTVKSSPNEKGTDLFIIHEGLKVSIIEISGNWREIKLPDGKIGWLPADSIEEI